MTLHPKNYWEVPEETARVARASFRKGNVYMKMYEELGTLYLDSDFKELLTRIGLTDTVRDLMITACQKRKQNANKWHC